MKIETAHILLTGASGGIGAALALALAQRGGRVRISGRDPQRLLQLRSELRARGLDATVLVADLATPGGADDLAARALALGPLHMLVNCAGAMHFGPFEEIEPATLERLWQTNVLAAMRLTRALLPPMLDRGAGHVINVGSVFGGIGYPLYTAYSATKFALRGFSEALRREVDGRGVHVTYAAPRYTRTALNAGGPEDAAKLLRMAQDEPADVAERIADAIASNRAEVVIGRPESFFVRLNALLPRLVDRALARQVPQLRSCASRDPAITTPDPAITTP